MPTLKLLFIFSVIGTSQLFTEAFVLRPLGYVADNITPNLLVPDRRARRQLLLRWSDGYPASAPSVCGSPLHYIFLKTSLASFTYQDGIFLRWFGNSLVYAVSITLGSTLICAMGGYAFSKYDFAFKQVLFNFILGTIMVPSTALVLPLFLMLNKVGLVNTIWGVILPSLVNPFGLYLMKTFWDSGFPR